MFFKSDETDPVKRYLDLSVYYRGTILHYISVLEFALNIYIAKYFCGHDNKKEEDIQTLLMGDERMNLGVKQQVFVYLGVNRDTGWYNSYVSIRPKPHKKEPYNLNSDLVWVIEQRNVFAHRILDTDQNSFLKNRKADTVRFLKFKNEFDCIDVTFDEFILLWRTIIHLTGFIQNRINTYSPSNSASNVPSEPSQGE